LEFPDSSFDGVRSDRTLQHVEDPERALTELVRVVKRGRRVVVMDPDWETLALDAID
jgi:ubiquinone/menaquinone biosynthesis C-methylase UbiE